MMNDKLKIKNKIKSAYICGNLRPINLKLFLFVLFVSFVVNLPALEIENIGVSNITRIAATLYGEVVSTNGTNPTVTVFYGTSDGSTNTGSWASSNVYGTAGVGVISTNITGLTPAQCYYFRWFAEDAAATNTEWATATSNFWTTAGAPTSTPTMTAHAVMVDTNGNLIAPTNLWDQNSIPNTSITDALHAQIETNTAAITTEVARATAAEEANTTSITTEVARATAAEEANTSSITTEVARAEAAEEANTSSITTEVARATAAEEANTSSITTEVARATAAEEANTGNINTNDTRITDLENAPAVTNRIMVYDGTFYTITNNPTSTGWVLKFDPSTSNAWFAADNDSGGGGAVTNKIMSYDGTLYTITNNPSSADDVLKFTPASTTAYFAAESGGGGISLTGYELAVNAKNGWGGYMTGGGSTTNNAIVAVGWSTANATNNYNSGWAFYSSSDNVIQDKYAYADIPIPSYATGWNTTAMIVRVRSSGIAITTNKVNLLFNDGSNTFATNNLVSNSANAWREYPILASQLPTSWTNDLDNIRPYLSVRGDYFSWQTNYIQWVEIRCDWD